MLKTNHHSKFHLTAGAVFFLIGLFVDRGWSQNESDESRLPYFHQWERGAVESGQSILMPHRPDESERDAVDKKFTTFAIFLPGVSVKEAWEVVNDKEGAAEFVGGVLKSKIVEKGGGWMVVEQETRIGGPKKSYRYVLKYNLFPHEKALFTYQEGEVRDVQGGWWFFERKDKKGMYLVYSLYIDPGIFAPQFIVRSGMKTSLPEALGYMKTEIMRRKKEAK